MAKFVKKAEIKKEVTIAKEFKAEVKRKTSKKFLDKVPETMVFWCHDGQVFNDLEQLMIGFDLMSDETFIFHANDDKNDFSRWIIDVIGDEELAKEIKVAKSKTEAKKITLERHNELKNQPS